MGKLLCYFSFHALEHVPYKIGPDWFVMHHCRRCGFKWASLSREWADA